MGAAVSGLGKTEARVASALNSASGLPVKCPVPAAVTGRGGVERARESCAVSVRLRGECVALVRNLSLWALCYF